MRVAYLKTSPLGLCYLYVVTSNYTLLESFPQPGQMPNKGRVYRGAIYPQVRAQSVNVWITYA
jgi:hypothetical protein